MVRSFVLAVAAAAVLAAPPSSALAGSAQGGEAAAQSTPVQNKLAQSKLAQSRIPLDGGPDESCFGDRYENDEDLKTGNEELVHQLLQNMLAPGT